MIPTGQHADVWRGSKNAEASHPRRTSHYNTQAWEEKSLGKGKNASPDMVRTSATEDVECLPWKSQPWTWKTGQDDREMGELCWAGGKDICTFAVVMLKLRSDAAQGSIKDVVWDEAEHVRFVQLGKRRQTRTQNIYKEHAQRWQLN